MSIVITNLVKQYGKQKAVNNLSFSVKENEIVGFLGPNGAGKSTTLKIATGYVRASSGSVLINNLDVEHNPIEIKKLIGYLPEHNPLYLDLYVHEYLRFSGRFYGIRGHDLHNKTAEAIEMCQLGQEQNKKIGQLSKGYRQRVGLAQALLHHPQVLILDEPTTGLDPNQIIEVRELIKTISKNRTVLFSTHIMQEVQAICDRVIIINNGKLVADNTVEQILSGGKKQILEIEFSATIDVPALKDFPGFIQLIPLQNNRYELELDTLEDARPALMNFIAELGLPLIGIKQKEISMEEVFSSLTQPQRDA